MNGNGIVYQFDSLLRPGPRHAPEWHRISENATVYPHQFRFAPDPVDSPEKGFIVPRFGDLRVSTLVDWREDVESGKNARYSKTQYSMCQVTSWTDPVAGGV